MAFAAVPYVVTYTLARPSDGLRTACMVVETVDVEIREVEDGSDHLASFSAAERRTKGGVGFRPVDLVRVEGRAMETVADASALRCVDPRGHPLACPTLRSMKGKPRLALRSRQPVVASDAPRARLDAMARAERAVVVDGKVAVPAPTYRAAGITEGTDADPGGRWAAFVDLDDPLCVPDRLFSPGDVAIIAKAWELDPTPFEAVRLSDPDAFVVDAGVRVVAAARALVRAMEADTVGTLPPDALFALLAWRRGTYDRDDPRDCATFVRRCAGALREGRVDRSHGRHVAAAMKGLESWAVAAPDAFPRGRGGAAPAALDALGEF